MFRNNKTKIGLIGLGYVGLPLAVEFGKKFPVIGFDTRESRILELLAGKDSTNELTEEELLASNNLTITSDLYELADCNIFIVTVPTPVDRQKQPDLTPLLNASEMIGSIVKKNDIVIYESTVYPGVTEESCIPVIEKKSGLAFNKDFFAGYSPERINPGDKLRKLKDIVKVTSGSNREAADFIDGLYGSIIDAGTYKAGSIKVAEASKIVENVQRDVNIALINELYQVFTNLGINTSEVLDAASTKWNFVNLSPGLVGGHCIGVDPYYLLHKSHDHGFIPDLMRTAREINDSMSKVVVQDFLHNLILKKVNPIDLDVLLCGFTFKENCPDIRNTKVYDVFCELGALGMNVTIFDPVANRDDALRNFGVTIVNQLVDPVPRVAFVAVAHDDLVAELANRSFEYIYDFKSIVKNVI